MGWLCIVSIALLALFERGPAVAAQGLDSEAAMSENVRRMHERLVALSRGEASLSDLRIEIMEGGMSSHRSFQWASGTLVSKEWASPGSPGIHREASVTAARVSALLRELIAKRYWSFQGTQFVPDAPTFLFRFYYPGVDYVDFRCDREELEGSPARLEIRDAFLKFVSETEMKPAR